MNLDELYGDIVNEYKKSAQVNTENLIKDANDFIKDMDDSELMEFEKVDDQYIKFNKANKSFELDKPSFDKGKSDTPTIRGNDTPTKAGETGSNSIDIDITYNEIENIVKSLKKSIDELKSNWESVINTDIGKLQGTWIGQDCATYIDKVLKMKTKVNNALDALKVLSETYEKSAEQIKLKQNEIAKSLERL